MINGSIGHIDDVKSFFGAGFFKIGYAQVIKFCFKAIADFIISFNSVNKGYVRDIRRIEFIVERFVKIFFFVAGIGKMERE